MKYGIYYLLASTIILSSCGDEPKSHFGERLKKERPVKKVEDVKSEIPSSDEWELVIMQNRSMGYATVDGDVMLQGDYSFCRLFRNGHASVRKNTDYKANEIYGKMGLINEKGKVIIPFEYAYTSDYADGLLAVQKERDGKLGYIDIDGKEVVEQKYDMGFSFKSKRARVLVGKYYDNLDMQKYNKCKYGFIDEKGNEVIPTEYDWAGDFADGIAPVSKGGRYYFINTKGEKVDDQTYSRLSGFKGDLCWVKKGRKGGFINKKNEVVLPMEYDNYMYFFTRGSNFGVSDKESEIGETRFTTKDDLFFVSKNGKFGIVTTENEVLTPFKYSELDLPKDGYVTFKVNGRDGLGSYADGKVTEIIPAKFDYLYHFRTNNFVEVGIGSYRDRKMGAYDLEGNMIIPLKYDDVEEIDASHINFGVKRGKLWALTDEKGVPITGFKYDYIGNKRDNGTIYATDGEMIIYLNESGNEVSREER